MYSLYFRPLRRIGNLWILTWIAFAGVQAQARYEYFGETGRQGRSGADGRPGRSGQNVVVQATGNTQVVDVSGTDGGDGLNGESGGNATDCRQPDRPAYDLIGLYGGSGGNGGDGGAGGNGGNITVYYRNLEDLRLISLRAVPGYGGRAGWGARGGQGCRCTQRSWEVSDGTSTYQFSCRDGEDGVDGSSGSNGARGSLGQVTVIGQLSPLAPEQPSIQIDMARMEAGPFQVSKNHWQARTGAPSLFASGSEIASAYRFFTGRSEASYAFRWEVPRPVNDFAGWPLVLSLDGDQAKVTFWRNLWYDGEEVVENGQKIFVFRGAVGNGEIGGFSFGRSVGHSEEHAIFISDRHEVSHILRNTVRLTLSTVENGRYVKRFEDDVPADLVTSTARGFTIAIGNLAIDPQYLALETDVRVHLSVVRSLGKFSERWTLSHDYEIRPYFDVNDLVEAVTDADRYSGTQVIGRITAGDRFHVVQVDRQWVKLKNMEGTTLAGWVKAIHLRDVAEQ